MRPVPWGVVLTLSLLVGCGQASSAHLPGKLAFVSDRFEPTRGIGLTARGVCVLEKGRIRDLLQMADYPRWNADGRRLYCRTFGGGVVVLSYPQGTVLREYQLQHDRRNFALLPDESGLIYVGWDTSFTSDEKEINTPENLYEYDFKSGKERQLTNFTKAEPPTLMDLGISPNGRWIIFTRTHPEPEEGVYLLNRETDQLRKLVVGRDSRFTPDGRVLFVSHFLKGEHIKTAEVFAYDLTTKEVKRLTHNGPDDLEYAPVMSPDGRYIAYEIQEFPPGSRASGLYVINADGTNERLLLGHDGHVYLTPDWGP